jgi:hypothetical protein
MSYTPVGGGGGGGGFAVWLIELIFSIKRLKVSLMKSTND